MNSKAGLSRLMAVVLLVAAALLSFLAYQCITTDMYKLYNDPYLTYSSRVEYYESQAQQKKADAETARAAGQESRALSYESTAAVWQGNADDGRDYLNRQRSGAISLGIGAAASVILAGWLFVRSGKKQKAAEAEPAGTKAAENQQ